MEIHPEYREERIIRPLRNKSKTVHSVGLILLYNQLIDSFKEVICYVRFIC